MKQGGSWRKMFLILLSFTTLGSESQISVFKQSQSYTQMSGFFFCWVGGGGGGGEAEKACTEAKIWNGKK